LQKLILDDIAKKKNVEKNENKLSPKILIQQLHVIHEIQLEEKM
jgi:hypothetical protein